ncbi:MarR family winged helix-turn-helix transcriptional regulator [Kineosporia babensis]|uniref:MarR family transcriptional regulator n=1 Tax=Kineosporia babensis TaxID=499548 RepID=A0A9X1NFS7_9ACTN|nr:MarR family transcriptional regulator [Kineosporia babensis]MCD5312258.1 MarR family transcriptional regulator [Kineosporia babensis]
MAEPRWLDQDEHRTWRSYLAVTRLLSAQLDRELQRDSGIPQSYYEILVRLSESPDRRLRMSDLADVSDSSRSRLSHAVARLVSNGWVERESCPTDRRGAFAVLTDAGFEALSNAAPAHVSSVRTHLFDRLTPEQVRQLGEINEAILSGLRETSVEIDQECTAREHAAVPDQARSDQTVPDQVA